MDVEVQPIAFNFTEQPTKISFRSSLSLFYTFIDVFHLFIDIALMDFLRNCVNVRRMSIAGRVVGSVGRGAVGKPY